MLYVERKGVDSYTYTCRDVFGEVTMTSTEKLQTDVLDLLIQHITTNPKAKRTEGSIKVKELVIDFIFVAETAWSDDDEDDEDLPVVGSLPK